MKIAIVDSGIDDRIISNEIIEIRNYTKEGKYDYCGHGTGCFLTIASYINKKVEYIIVKVLNRNGCTDLLTLKKALQDLLNDEIDIICMALSINESVSAMQSQVINWLCEKLYAKGTYIVVAYKNGSKNSWPASLKCVIGVQGALFQSCNEIWADIIKNNVVADCAPFFFKDINGKFSFLSGNSKACGVTTAYIANKILLGKRKIEEFMEDATKTEWTEEEVNLEIGTFLHKNKRLKKVINEDKFRNLKEVCESKLDSYLSQEFYEEKISIDDQYYYRVKCCDEILSTIEKFCNIRIVEGTITVNTFCNIYELYDSLYIDN